MTYNPKFNIINVREVEGYQGPMEVGELDCSTEPILSLLAVWVAKHYNAGIGEGKKTDKIWPYLTLYDATTNLDWESYDSERDYACIYDGEEGSDPLAPYIKKSPAFAAKVQQLTPLMEIALCALHKELILCMNDEAVLDLKFINWEA